MSHIHFHNICRCGATISQCRCFGPKPAKIVCDECDACRKKADTNNHSVVLSWFEIEDCKEAIRECLNDESASKLFADHLRGNGTTLFRIVIEEVEQQ